MKKWDFKIKNSPDEVSKKIKSVFKSTNGLVFSISQNKSKPIRFKMRKRILYPWYLYFINSIVVNGKLSKAETENESKVEIYFKQHFLWVLVVFTNIILGLALFLALVFQKSSSNYVYLIGTLILVIGIILMFRIHKKYEKNIQEYKILISEILGIN
ncbi:DUF423 domain-containing protein [Flavobacteriaceae bacterium XHP0103]|uniref:DUF423 domain-containing protein n=1 Tax=Marixanthotalea marina TaxID=2844359 RepID=UPI002989AF41|nr:DUF423 domain-containing protein [Marixanthotalea marina]MBU3822996.1 DUF423 domain-containing protein [Marixanthotalea marina]